MPSFQDRGTSLALTIGLILKAPSSSPEQAQEAALRPLCDRLLLATRLSQPAITAALARAGLALQPGITIMLADFNSLQMSQSSLVDFLIRLRAKGVSLAIASPSAAVDADGRSDTLAFLELYRAHLTARRNAPRSSHGRKPKLSPEQVREIRRLLDNGQDSAGRIAKQFGISRSTLYNYLAKDGPSGSAK